MLVSDNGRQFDNTPFRDFCEQLGINNHYSLPSHPQANGQAEVEARKLRIKSAKYILMDDVLYKRGFS